MRRATRWAAVLLGLGLACLLVVAFEIRAWARDHEFQSREWKTAAGGRSDGRLRMVDDLLDSGRLTGKTRDAVLGILGPDDSAAGTGWGAGYFVGWDLVYWLGPERGFISIDSEWLVIRLGSSGTVTACALVTD